MRKFIALVVLTAALASSATAFANLPGIGSVPKVTQTALK